MIKTYRIESGQEATKEQLREVEEAKKYPIFFDNDCPELSPMMADAFKNSIIRRNKRKKA